MKNRLLMVICVVLAAVCITQTVFLVRNNNVNNDLKPTSATPANTTGDDYQFKLSLLHLYYESSSIVSTLPFTTVQVTESALIKAFMSKSSATDALAHIDRYADRTLASAYKTMDEVLDKFNKILKKYNIASTSSYTAKYNKLKAMFDSLRNSSTELLSRTRTLIKMCNSNDYDSYYTKYVEQLSDLTNKIEQNNTAILDEYNSLIESISNDYDIISLTKE